MPGLPVGSPTLRDLGVLAAATLAGTLLLVGTWLLPDAGTAVSPDLEDPTFVLWTLGWDLHQILRDPLRLFEANVSWPARGMLARTETMLGCLPSYALFRGLGAGPVAAYNLTLLGSYWLSALAMAWLVRRWTGNLTAASLVGLAYALAPLHLSDLGRLQLMQGMWFPLLLLAWENLLERPGPRTAAGLGLVLAGLFASCIYFFLQALVGAPLYGLLTLRSASRPARVLAWAAVAGLAAGVLLLPLLLPYYRMLHQWPQERVLTFNAYHSADFTDFLSVPPENVVLGPWLAGFNSGRAPRATALFPGVLLLLGAAAAVWRRTRRVGPLLALAALSALLAVGPAFEPFGVLPSPYRLLHEHMPGFSAHRVPARFGFLMVFALAAAAGPGLAALLDRRRPLLVAALVGLLIADGLTPMPRIPVPPLPGIYRDLARQEPGVTLELPMFPDLEPSPSLEGLRHFYSTFHRQTLVNGYPLVTPPVTHEIADLVRPGPTDAAIAGLQMLGVRYLVVHTEQMPPHQGDWSDLETRGFRLLARHGPDLLWQVPAGTPAFGGPEVARWGLKVPPVLPLGVSFTAGLAIDGGRIPAFRPVPGTEPVQVRWEGPAVLERVQRTLPPTWVFPQDRLLRQLPLQAPRVPGAYRLTVAGEGWSASAPVEIRGEPVPYTLPTEVGIAWSAMPASLEPGQALRVQGEVRNLGPQPLKAGSLSSLPDETWLWARWRGPGTYGPAQRRPLRIDLFPGQEAPWVFTTRAPQDPGRWRLEIVFAGAGGPDAAAVWTGREVEVRARGARS